MLVAQGLIHGEKINRLFQIGYYNLNIVMRNIVFNYQRYFQHYIRLALGYLQQRTLDTICCN